MTTLAVRIARDFNQIGNVLFRRRHGEINLGIRFPFWPRRRVVVTVDLRLRTTAMAQPCRCGSGIMVEPQFLGCSICQLPRPAIERARLFPGRLQ